MNLTWSKISGDTFSRDVAHLGLNVKPLSALFYLIRLTYGIDENQAILLLNTHFDQLLPHCFALIPTLLANQKTEKRRSKMTNWQNAATETTSLNSPMPVLQDSMVLYRRDDVLINSS